MFVCVGGGFAVGVFIAAAFYYGLSTVSRTEIGSYIDSRVSTATAPIEITMELALNATTCESIDPDFTRTTYAPFPNLPAEKLELHVYSTYLRVPDSCDSPQFHQFLGCGYPLTALSAFWLGDYMRVDINPRPTVTASYASLIYYPEFNGTVAAQQPLCRQRMNLTDLCARMGYPIATQSVVSPMLTITGQACIPGRIQISLRCSDYAQYDLSQSSQLPDPVLKQVMADAVSCALWVGQTYIPEDAKSIHTNLSYRFR